MRNSVSHQRFQQDRSIRIPERLTALRQHLIWIRGEIAMASFRGDDPLAFQLLQEFEKTRKQINHLEDIKPEQTTQEELL